MHRRCGAIRTLRILADLEGRTEPVSLTELSAAHGLSRSIILRACALIANVYELRSWLAPGPRAHTERFYALVLADTEEDV